MIWVVYLVIFELIPPSPYTTDLGQSLFMKQSELLPQCRHRNKYKLKALAANKKDRAFTKK